MLIVGVLHDLDITFEEHIEMAETTPKIPPMQDNLPRWSFNSNEIILANKAMPYLANATPIMRVGAELLKKDNAIADSKRFNILLDPGGKNLESDETIREVELFWRVMIIVQKNRVDVPFDPGGCGSKTKLEDEFFRRWGV
ncbi:hypothetical protein HanIR_Chr02g0089421 [Helianthus annuus]|nr:hypothetical protein HanIR_Chr02g0089421 [Helianthus annuus]